MLMPALQQARAKARQSTCTSNLKQWGIMIGQYADAYDDFLIPSYMSRKVVNGGTVIWCDERTVLRHMIAPGTRGNVWKRGDSINGCPEATDANAKKDGVEIDGTPERYYSYCHSTGVLGTLGSPHKITHLKSHSKYAAFADATYYTITADNYHIGYAHPRLKPRHQGGNAVNIVHTDGHVETFTGPAIMQGKMPLISKFAPGIDGCNGYELKSRWLKN
ncbi:MAG: DUF1559 domain-containing protein [Lentisphaeria bacterium]|nr:DUF1559 domain-containing protein [Lentisphaeria bacterium]